MEFSTFMQRLFPVIGFGSSTHAFTKSMLEAILTDDSGDILDVYSKNTYKAYYNGTTKITRIAQKIGRFVEPEEFVKYIQDLSDANVQRLCADFKNDLPGIDQHNAGCLLAECFEKIIKDAASVRRKQKSSVSNVEPRSHEADAPTEDPDRAWKSLLSNHDQELLSRFRKQSKPILRYCIENDPTATWTSGDLPDCIDALVGGAWRYDLREISDDEVRNLIIEIIETISQYRCYISDKYLRYVASVDKFLFRNESWEEGQRLRNEFQPESLKLRKKMADLYQRLYPIPEDSDCYTSERTEQVEAEAMDDTSPSSAKDDKKITVIQNQTNVVQNGENNFNLTNNGTMNFNF